MAANLPAPAAPPATGRVFPGGTGQVREARRFLAGVLDGCPAGDDALLCVSELATNAVLHSLSGRPGGRFSVRATVRAGRVRAEVQDEGGPWRPAGEGNGQSGRGLVIVGELASRWGRDDGDTGRTVWFEIDW
jgi:serine/threonine-protein kinase RsbW